MTNETTNEPPETETPGDAPHSVREIQDAIGETLCVAVDALAHTVQAQAQTIERLSTPEPDRFTPFMMDLINTASPLLVQMLQQRTTAAPNGGAAIGPRERQVRAEFDAEEAKLRSAFTEARARLVADFGPRFTEAHAEDEAASVAAFAAATGRNGVGPGAPPPGPKAAA